MTKLTERLQQPLTPREIVARDRATKYSDEEIRENIALGIDVNHYTNPIYFTQIAQAMIAYNRMIDERTLNAERSWRGQ